MFGGDHQELVRNVAFRRFWIAAGLSELTANVARISFVLLVHELASAAHDHPERETALVYALESAPLLIVGPIAGALVDRWDRRWVLIVGAAVASLLMLAIPILAGASSRTPVISMALVFSILTAIHAPTRLSAVPDLVPERQLAAANGLISTTSGFALIAGMSLAGLSAAIVGKLDTFRLCAFAYATVALLMSRVRLPRHGHGLARGHFVRELVQGLRHILAVPQLAFMTVVYFATYAFVGAFQALLPAFCAQRLARDPDRWVPIVLTSLGIGGLLGGLSIGRLAIHFGRGRLFLVSLLGVVVGVIGFALNETANQAALLAVASGAALFALQALDATITQSLTPPEIRGRVFGTRQPLQAVGFLLAAGAVMTLPAPAPTKMLFAAGTFAAICASALLLPGARALARR